MCVHVCGDVSVVSAVCNDWFFVVHVWHLGSGRACSTLGYFRGGCNFFSIMVFLQMDSVYSLVVWHATSLKNDHCALLLYLFLNIHGALHRKPRVCLGLVAFTANFFFFALLFSVCLQVPIWSSCPGVFGPFFFKAHFEELIHNWNNSWVPGITWLKSSKDYSVNQLENQKQ